MTACCSLHACEGSINVNIGKPAVHWLCLWVWSMSLYQWGGVLRSRHVLVPVMEAVNATGILPLKPHTSDLWVLVSARPVWQTVWIPTTPRRVHACKHLQSHNSYNTHMYMCIIYMCICTCMYNCILDNVFIYIWTQGSILIAPVGACNPRNSGVHVFTLSLQI